MYIITAIPEPFLYLYVHVMDSVFWIALIEYYFL